MTRRIMAAILTIMLLFSGCTTVRVSQDYRMDIAFSDYHSYDWKTMDTAQESGNIRIDNPLLHERFHQAIDRTMASRGYTRQKTAQFLVSYTYSMETRIESSPYGSHTGIGFGRRHRYGAFSFGDYADISQYEVGILAISFYDAVSGTLIWRGLGTERADMHASPEETTAFVDTLVAAVLAQFPPR